MSRRTLRQTALTPIFWLAGVNAGACWLAGWLFRERVVFSGTLIGLGFFGVVVALFAWLYVPSAKVDRSE